MLHLESLSINLNLLIGKQTVVEVPECAHSLRIVHLGDPFLMNWLVKATGRNLIGQILCFCVKKILLTAA